jgi:hypothetical protein
MPFSQNQSNENQNKNHLLPSTDMIRRLWRKKLSTFFMMKFSALGENGE